MNEHDNNHSNEPANDAGDSVATAIRLAGPREMPPRADRERVFAAASASLQQKRAAQRRVRNRRTGFAIAATLLLAVGGGLLLQTQQTDIAVAQARVDRVAGRLEWQSNDVSGWQPVAENTTLAGNVSLRTLSDSRAGIVMANGVSVRLATDTAIDLVDKQALRLDKGKVYIDAGIDRSTSIEVITPAGTARDIGTQFEVRYRKPELRLRIREGSVRFASADTQLLANAGEEVTVDDAGAVNQQRYAVDNQDWLWAEELAPVPDFDGQPLAALLDWVSRETGRPVRFASDAVGAQVRATVLHGSISKMSPLDTLSAMLSTTDFSYRLEENGTILIYAER